MKKQNDQTELNTFKKDKVLHLNKFFMRNVIITSIFTILIFILSVIGLIIIVNIHDIDQGLKITLISITATFILTTSKTLIDKSIQIVSYIIVFLSEEQRGIHRDLGIDVDKVEFDSSGSEIE
jgi:hypothetical protein